MRFEVIDDTIFFYKSDKQYRVVMTDVTRLVARPGTRVLNLIDKDEKKISMPIDTAVGELEGYLALIDSTS